ncbi:hypothetical protein JCM3770_007359 [Rhodotorula araucariae]
MPASQPERALNDGAPLPLPPAVARVRSDSAWDGQDRGKGKVRATTLDSCDSPQPSHAGDGPATPLGAISNGSSNAPSASSRQPGSMPTVSSTTRRLGALGIPLPSDSGDDIDFEQPSTVGSTGSLEGNAPASPAVPVLEAPEATYSGGGSTRSGPSTRSGEQLDGGAFVSEQSFRDIVDELTLQNQRLKARLKRFESARVPTNLRNERLFEVRFFDGLPKQRRREIESFLTDYVQTLSSSASSGDLVSSSSRVNATGESSNHGHTESTSSLGATLRSLRSSERELLGREALLAAGGGGAPSGARSASGSGSGSGSGLRKRSRETELPPAMEPLGATPVPTMPDPPALLRRPTDIFPPERDVLAAPSFSGVEPRSTMGTGSGMRISDPTTKKRKRAHDSPEAATSPERPQRVRRAVSREGSMSSSTSGTPDPERLEFLIVEMIERLFSESLPTDAQDPSQSPPPNPLHSEPQPLPAQSLTNTAYLRAMLESEEAHARGGWLYLNLVSTMAAMHRLNVSIGTVRHALRTKSSLIEVSEEGNKIRWKGPRTKPLPRPQDFGAPIRPDFGMGDMDDNSIEATRMEGVEQAEREAAGRRRDKVPTATRRGSCRSTHSSDGEPDSMFDERPGQGSSSRQARTGSGSGSGNGQPSKGSTAPTSQYPSNGSKNGSSSQGEQRFFTAHAQDLPAAVEPSVATDPVVATGRAQLAAAPTTGSTLRHAIDAVPPSGAGDVSGEGDNVRVLGSTPQPAPNRLLYTPLFVRRNSASDKGSVDDGSEAPVASDDAAPVAKRRKECGGVVFFANPLFYSDLAGDLSARMQALRDHRSVLDVPDAVLSAPSSVGADGTSAVGRGSAADEAASRARSSLTPLSEGDTHSYGSLNLDIPVMKRTASSASDGAASIVSPIDGQAGWAAIEPVDFASSPPTLSSAEEHDVFRVTPHPNLQLSATSDVTAADHFTIHVKHAYTPYPAGLDRHALPRRIRPSFASILPPPLLLHLHAPAVVSSVCVTSHTVHHHPSACVRFPRLSMRMSSSASDTDESESFAHGSASPTSTQLQRLVDAYGSSGADYLMSLALPLNHWAPDARPMTSSDERASEAVRGDSASLLTLD